MTFIQFATAAAHPDLTPDDLLAADALTRLGIRVEPVVWSDPAPADAGVPDAVVIRSCWDYHLREREFTRWIAHLEQTGVNVINPPALVRWNLHKNYLTEIAALGIPVAPTVWIRPADARSLRDILDAAGWDQAVVKPAISASAYETWRTDSDAPGEHEERFARLRSASDVLVQKFLTQVTSDGEWSLVFFGVQFSHAVRKRPKRGDFRVQPEHGGSHQLVAPSQRLIDDAQRVLGALPNVPVYCRVDGVIVEDVFTVMEVECIDPVLFFGLHAPGALAFAREVLNGLVRRGNDGG